MDNDAFKDLVRSKVKTTKEIAREAVEDAFRKKKKRKRKGRGGGGGDDDDLSSSESESESRQHNKREKALQPTVVRKKWGKGAAQTKKEEEDGEDATALRYRDRAKERREGKNEDYKDTEAIMETVAASHQQEDSSSMNQTEMAKYLGGDIAHTHLVKGLDVALARQQKQHQSADNDSESHEGGDEQAAENFKPINTQEEAWVYISRGADTSTVRSTLGRSMLEYLKGRRKQDWSSVVSTTAAGASVQRSQITFSMVGNHPLNLATCWETPMETSHAATTSAHNSTSLSKASPLDVQLIYKIQQIQKPSISHKEVGMMEDKGDDTSERKDQQQDKAAEAMEEDSDDEDIFQIAGDVQ